jgi:hypothetical protein
MDIKAARIGMKARTPNGRESEIVGIFHDGTIAVDFGPGDYHWIKFNASCLEPVSDPCEGCQKLSSMNESLEYWQTECVEARRNATYWREELTKLQKEALKSCDYPEPHMAGELKKFRWGFLPGGKWEEIRPMPEVAKCYVQVAPEKPLMSQEARRAVEYISAKGGSLDIDAICDGLKCCMDYLCDHLAEARDAGRISLVNGKYEIVRD